MEFQTCPKCGCPVVERDRHRAFHAELENLAAAVASHHVTPDCHVVSGPATADLRDRSTAVR